MEYKTRFEIGDIIYKIKKVDNTPTINCPICKGCGTLVARDYPNLKLNCPECRGNGKQRLYALTTSEWTPDEIAAVSAITVIFDKYGTPKEQLYCRDTLHDNDYYFGEARDCFKGEEEAQAECDKRNKKEQQ